MSGPHIYRMRIAIVTHRATQTNLGLAAASPLGIRTFLGAPEEALQLEPGDAARAASTSVRRLTESSRRRRTSSCSNTSGSTPGRNSSALRRAHDKLATTPALAAAGLPHPRTQGLFDCDGRPPLRFPFVVKPRYGSWGRRRLPLRRRARVRAGARRAGARERGSRRPAPSRRSWCLCSVTTCASSSRAAR